MLPNPVLSRLILGVLYKNRWIFILSAILMRQLCCRWKVDELSPWRTEWDITWVLLGQKVVILWQC